MVLGRTIQLGTALEYEPLDANEIHIASEQFGVTKFRIGDLDRSHWARYAQAAARVAPRTPETVFRGDPCRAAETRAGVAQVLSRFQSRA